MLMRELIFSRWNPYSTIYSANFLVDQYRTVQVAIARHKFRRNFDFFEVTKHFSFSGALVNCTDGRGGSKKSENGVGGQGDGEGVSWINLCAISLSLSKTPRITSFG